MTLTGAAADEFLAAYEERNRRGNTPEEEAFLESCRKVYEDSRKKESRPMSKLRPLSDILLVKRIDAPEKTGSLYVPDVAKEKSCRARVIAAGPGKWDRGHFKPMECAPGDVVVLEKWVGSELKVEGEDCLFVREEQCLAVMKKEEP